MVSRDGVSNPNLDDSAIFIGIFDEASFDRVRLTMPGLFLQNQLDILTSGSTVPEPSALALLAMTLPAVFLYLRFHHAVREDRPF